MAGRTEIDDIAEAILAQERAQRRLRNFSYIVGIVLLALLTTTATGMFVVNYNTEKRTQAILERVDANLLSEFSFIRCILLLDFGERDLEEQLNLCEQQAREEGRDYLDSLRESGGDAEGTPAPQGTEPGEQDSRFPDTYTDRDYGDAITDTSSRLAYRTDTDPDPGTDPDPDRGTSHRRESPG